MFAEYIAAALERAEYEIIDDPDPYYFPFRTPIPKLASISTSIFSFLANSP